jgi:hypothetical protein
MSCIDRMAACGVLALAVTFGLPAAAEPVPEAPAAAPDPAAGDLTAPADLERELARIRREIVLERARQELEETRQKGEALRLQSPHGAAAKLPDLPPVPAGGPGPGGLRGPAAGAAPGYWLPLAIYGVDGRLSVRLRATGQDLVADVAVGDVLPDGTRVVGLTPERVRLKTGDTERTLAVMKYGPGVFQAPSGGAP